MKMREFVEIIANLQEVSFEEAKGIAIKFIETHPEINRELLKGVVYD